jgi:hypothetical protein
MVKAVNPDKKNTAGCIKEFLEIYFEPKAKESDIVEKRK